MNPRSLIRTMLVDDEPLARKNLQLLLARDESIDIAAQCENGNDALLTLQKEDLDLVYLDIQMPGMSGIELLRNLDIEKVPFFVFTTAFDEFALNAFELHALDYLLKPFTDERFYRSLEHAKENIRQQRIAQFGNQIKDFLKTTGKIFDVDLSAAPETNRKLAFKSEGSVYLLEPDDIVWIEAADYNVRIHTTNKSYLVRESLQSIEQRLPEKRFLRIHRSTIINVQHAKELCTAEDGNHALRLKDGTSLPVSRSRKKLLSNALIEN